MSSANTVLKPTELARVRVLAYDEAIDVFKLGAFGFTDEDESVDPDYCRGAPDFDDFEVPGIVLPALLGEYGEPAELIGRVFSLWGPFPR